MEELKRLKDEEKKLIAEWKILNEEYWKWSKIESENTRKRVELCAKNDCAMKHWPAEDVIEFEKCQDKYYDAMHRCADLSKLRREKYEEIKKVGTHIKIIKNLNRMVRIGQKRKWFKSGKLFTVESGIEGTTFLSCRYEDGTVERHDRFIINRKSYILDEEVKE